MRTRLKRIAAWLDLIDPVYDRLNVEAVILFACFVALVLLALNLIFFGPLL